MHLGDIKQQEGESLKSIINRFTIDLSKVRWAPDFGVLAHLTNGILLETPLLDELQQKEYKSMSEFYHKASKYLKLERSKEALKKFKESATSKKTSQGKKNKEKK